MSTAVKAQLNQRSQWPGMERRGADLKPRYKVDLAAQQADCELNFVRLRNLLVDMAERDQWVFAIGNEATATHIQVTVTERAPYTTTLSLVQDMGNKLPAQTRLNTRRLTVRLYQDAQMAEVIAWENHRRWQPRYEYPNSNMYHSDEKAQLNRYLCDLLALCQSQGRVVTDISDLGIGPA